MLPKRLLALRQDKFLRAAGVLVGGTAAAQAIGLLALPLLTRFYTPENFSLLAVYVAVLTMTAAVTCMRFDTAIPLAENDDEAASLLVLALASAAIFIVLSVSVVVLFGPSLARAAGHPEIVPHLWLIPFGIALTGLYSSFQYMAMRQKAFMLIARTKLTQATVGLGSQVWLGWLGIVPLGLLLGHALMSGAGVLALAVKTLRRPTGQGAFSVLTIAGVGDTLRKYRRFPQYSVAEELTNNAGIQLPILLIASFLVGPEAGFLFLAMRAIGTPMTIIGSAVAQVYYSHAAEYARDGRLAEETATVFKRLSRLLVVPMVVLGPLAPEVFRAVFGAEWERAGVLLVWMLPWYAFRLVASPISMAMYVQNLQGRIFALSVLGLFIRLVPLGFVLYAAPQHASVTFAVSSAAYYLILLIPVLVACNIPFWGAIRLVAQNILLWVTAGSISFLVFNVLMN